MSFVVVPGCSIIATNVPNGKIVPLHFLLALAVLFVSVNSLASQTQNYPFSIETEKEGNGHRIVARNHGPAPVSVRVAIVDAHNIITDRALPTFAVVPPGGGILYLARISPAVAGIGYTFRTQNIWLLGDFNAVQSPEAIYRLPYRDGLTFRIGQAPGGPVTTHTSQESQFAVDIGMPEGTPVVAARDGVVIFAAGDEVDGRQTPDMMNKANEVRIQHVDGTMASYAHLAHGGVYVYPGQRVAAGTQIGLAGSTGYSSGPHLHFAVLAIARAGDSLSTVSLPFQFYVGNPPVIFPPEFGVVARAEYGSLARIPRNEVQAQVARAAPTRSSVAVGGNPGVMVTFEVPSPVRSFLGEIPAWKWIAGVVALVFLLMLIEKRRQATQRREYSVNREPSIRSRPGVEPIHHGLTEQGRLLIACGGDRRKADRLQAYEYERFPHITDEEAARRARERLQRDRG